MMIALLAATVLLADAAPAATPAPAAPAAKAEGQKTAAADQNKLICKSEPVLGSRMPVKKCRTAGDAAAEKLQAQQELAKMQGDNNISSK